MNKFLTIVFIVFLVAGAGYFFYGNSFKNNESKSLKTETMITPSKAPVFVDERQALDQLVIDELTDLKIFKKGVLKSSVITNVLEGKIISIKKPSELADKTTEMASITIEGKAGYKNTFLFTTEEISRTKIFEDKDQRIPMEFESLNINDFITLESNIKIYSKEKDDISNAVLMTITKN